MAYRDVILADTAKFYWRADANPAANALFHIMDQSGNNSQSAIGQNISFSTQTGLIAASDDTNPAMASSAAVPFTLNTAVGTQTGNGPWTIEGWMQFAANPASNQTFFGVC